jgi:hypothetical protein
MALSSETMAIEIMMIRTIALNAIRSMMAFSNQE